MSVETLSDGDDSRKFAEGAVGVNKISMFGWATDVSLHDIAIVQLIGPIVFRSRPTANDNLEARADQRFGDVFRWPVYDQDYANRLKYLYRIDVHNVSS